MLESHNCVVIARSYIDSVIFNKALIELVVYDLQKLKAA